MDYLSLCLICKDENTYLEEWLDYHILAGVDRFYIYDNQSKVSLRESLEKYIEKGWVILHQISGTVMQLHAYDHCLANYGEYTRWLGFIDTDEFLVPKKTDDLKDVLKEFEGYGALAVSSLFYGTNGHVSRPKAGQIASYIRRTPDTFVENNIIKSIVQPQYTVGPSTPHDFVMKTGCVCVNEHGLLVHYQRFPHSSEVIQLNHYVTRSRSEIELKNQRGRGDMVASWPMARYNLIDLQSVYPDSAILSFLERKFQANGYWSEGLVGNPEKFGLLEKLSLAAETMDPAPFTGPAAVEMSYRQEFLERIALRKKMVEAEARNDLGEYIRLALQMLEFTPEDVFIHVVLSEKFSRCGDKESSWGILAEAWRIAPQSYMVLFGMTGHYIMFKDYDMAEKTCRLLMEFTGSDLQVLGYLTTILIGQKRMEDALKVGLPLVELGSLVGELRQETVLYVIKCFSDYFKERKEYGQAVHLWSLAVQNYGAELYLVTSLLESLRLNGEHERFEQILSEALTKYPGNETLLAFKT